MGKLVWHRNGERRYKADLQYGDGGFQIRYDDPAHISGAGNWSLFEQGPGAWSGGFAGSYPTLADAKDAAQHMVTSLGWQAGSIRTRGATGKVHGTHRTKSRIARRAGRR